MNQNNQPLHNYTYEPTELTTVTYYPGDPGNPDPFATEAKTFIVIKDASGNVVEVIDAASGEVAASYHDGPFGEKPTGTAAACSIDPFGFADGWTDAMGGLVDIGNRWHSPDESRFMSEDPSELTGGINLYESAGNDPINSIDPSGLGSSQSNAPTD